MISKPQLLRQFLNDVEEMSDSDPVNRCIRFTFEERFLLTDNPTLWHNNYTQCGIKFQMSGYPLSF